MYLWSILCSIWNIIWHLLVICLIRQEMSKYFKFAWTNLLRHLIMIANPDNLILYSHFSSTAVDFNSFELLLISVGILKALLSATPWNIFRPRSITSNGHIYFAFPFASVTGTFIHSLLACNIYQSRGYCFHCIYHDFAIYNWSLHFKKPTTKRKCLQIFL